MTGLAGQLKPCGPVLDSELAARTREPVEAAAREGGWLETLDTAWPALEPVFAAAPYLAGLARRGPERLRAILETTPDDRLAAIVGQTDALTGGADDLRAPLRGLKADLHLLTALCDLGGVWDLDRVTGALTPPPAPPCAPWPMTPASGAGWSAPPMIRADPSPACSPWPWANTGRAS
jgi:glutamate-ammonia-ligase adenylyltransferase